MTKKSTKRSAKSRRVLRNMRDTNPGPLRQDVGRQGTSAIPRNFLSTTVSGVSPSIRRTLTWVYNGFSTITAGLYAEPLVCVLNSPFDPDNAVGGTSAQGFAKYMALYSKCFVLSARVRIRYVLAGVTASGGPPTSSSHVGATITTNNTALSSVVNAVEQGLCQYDVHNCNPDRGEIVLAVNVSKFVNKPDILDDPQFFCTASANPSQLICLHFWNIATLATNVSMTWIIEVEFDSVFTDPIPFT
jgi:hypothetical protein